MKLIKKALFYGGQARTQRWFDIINCSPKNPITHANDERLEWLHDFAGQLLLWKEDALQRREPKRVLAQPTLEGLIFTTHNFIALRQRLLEHPRLEYVCLRTFSQDVLEALFGILVNIAVAETFLSYKYSITQRQLGGRVRNPDVAAVAYALHHITQVKSFRRMRTGNKSTFHSANYTAVNDEPLLKKAKL